MWTKRNVCGIGDKVDFPFFMEITEGNHIHCVTVNTVGPEGKTENTSIPMRTYVSYSNDMLHEISPPCNTTPSPKNYVWIQLNCKHENLDVENVTAAGLCFL